MKYTETLEEAAESIYKEFPNNPKEKQDWTYGKDIHCFKKRKAFIKGGKFQEQRMHSDEEVLNILERHTEDLLAGKNVTLTEWFQQFKKGKP